MSRIQKALEVLRESRGNPGRGSELGPPTLQNGIARQSAPVPNRKRVQIRVPVDREETIRTEALPSDVLHVDVDVLVEAGLYPSTAHAEPIAQQFRRIKRPVINLAFGEALEPGENSNLVMVASALPKSGKTWCSVNLAASVARERDVGAVLVDADVLKPNISRALGLEDRVGLIDHLLDPEVSLDDIIVPTDFHDIVVIPAGQKHEEATELLASRRMERFVAGLSARFRSRLIVVDTPPLLLTNEAHVLAEHMGQIIMVIESGVTTQQSAMQALESLNRSKPINAILNKARGGFFSDYSPYASGYGSSPYGYYGAPEAGNEP